MHYRPTTRHQLSRITATAFALAAQLTADYPDLNVLINNAGVLQSDQAGARIDDALMMSAIATNLIGRTRLTSALIEHLKTRKDAVVAYISSVLAFVLLAMTAVYSSTKAALHSYILSQRVMLRDTTARVLEIATRGPTWALRYGRSNACRARRSHVSSRRRTSNRPSRSSSNRTCRPRHGLTNAAVGLRE